MTRQTFAPSLEEIAALARVALARLPQPFLALTDGVALHVEDFADEDVLRDLGIESPFDLSGLYHGRGIGGEAATGDMPPAVFLYRRPILDEWAETGESLEDLVAHILVHEIGHHMGLSDEDIERVEAGA